MRDSARTAYATLGLPPTASPAEVRKKYKTLVKQWHPDRFATDTVAQGEATQRMREINDAYRTIRGTYLGRAAEHLRGEPPPARGRPSPPPGARLSREQIDRLVGAIGAYGPLDLLFGSLQWYGSLVYAGFVIFLVVGGILSLVFDKPLAPAVVGLSAVLFAYVVWRLKAARMRG